MTDQKNNSGPSPKKYTVLLPQTTFPMKGDLPKREPELLSFWQDQDIVGRWKQKTSAPLFVLPDGPPYANGSIHIGHALNKTLKDIILKYKNLKGYQALFRPGWDCHGLPIEQAVSKKLKDKAGAGSPEQSPDQIRQLCRAEAEHWVGIQKEQFKRLGIFADWEHPYRTLDPAYEAEEVREFARAFQKGVIYRGLKPVYWNWSLQTALAEAEVEYHPHKSLSTYVLFPMNSKQKEVWSLSSSEAAAFLIWTTTPWTLPANVAVCLNSEFEYGLYHTPEHGHLVMAVDLAPAVSQQTGVTLQWVRQLKGQDLVGLFLHHPFLEREVPVICGEHVTKEAGTGCVHTAPGHGPDDYQVGLRYRLPILSPVGPDGCFTSEVSQYQGVHILKANPLIVEQLKEKGALLHVSTFEHSYPHCWRTKIPLIYRATYQWFMGLDQPQTQIRQKTLAAMDNLKFYPEWGRARFRAMIENRPDWCLSRQRIWGVPIPVFICKKTGEPLAQYEIMMKIADVIEQQGGIDAYYRLNPQEVIGQFKVEGEFGSEGFIHGQDILDVWFDSGICHAAVQAKTPGLAVPADIYLEGSDQHRGWFNTSMLSSMVTRGEPPFKALVTHGFIQQSKGVKMSKSKGGGMDPLEFSNTKGADILRLWCAHEDYGKDIVWGEDLVERVTETYRRLRNTMRFLLGAVADFDQAPASLTYNQLTRYDQWALHRLNQLTVQVTEAYEQYSFYKVYHLINQYVTVDLSALYVDVLKDRLYTWPCQHPERRSAQWVLSQVLHHLNVMIAPILSFLAEEVYQHQKTKAHKSVFFESFPEPNSAWEQPELAQQVDMIFKIREEVQKQLEEMRAQKQLGSSLEARVHLQLSSDFAPFMEVWQEALREIFIVSQFSFELNLSGSSSWKVQCFKAEGEKCPRCWMYAPQLDIEHGVCPKCLPAHLETISLG